MTASPLTGELATVESIASVALRGFSERMALCSRW